MNSKSFPDASLTQSIHPEEINRLPLKSYPGPISLISTDQSLNDAIEEIKNESLLGFDTESKASFKPGVIHPVSLVQLATSRHAFLIQIRRIRNITPLLHLLEKPELLKIGIALADDIRKLREPYHFSPAGFIDLGLVARQWGMPQSGLRNLTAKFLGFRISKSMQRSDWSRHDLSSAQKAYAATDAWAPRELFLCWQVKNLINDKGLALCPPPPYGSQRISKITLPKNLPPSH